MNQYTRSGEFQLPAVMTIPAPPEPIGTTLTEAEIAALQFLAEGLTIKQMSYDMGISESAVKARIQRAKKRLSARTSTQCVAIASVLGFIIPKPTQ